MELHSAIIYKASRKWQDIIRHVLAFSAAGHTKRAERAFIKMTLCGGLIRSFGGWQAVKAMRRLRLHAKGDERILGESDFVLQVLKEHNEQLEKRSRMRLGGVDAQRAAARVGEIFGLSFSELSQGSRLRSVVRARSVLCYWAVKELGMSGAQAARWLGIGQPAVQRSVLRGGKIVRELNPVLSP